MQVVNPQSTYSAGASKRKSEGTGAADKQEIGPKALYDKLIQYRMPFVNRAEDSAKFTIPALMPPAHSNSMAGHNDLYQPYQSLGARGVNTMAANLLMSLLPPNQSFFRLVVDEKAKMELGDPSVVGEIERSLSNIEQVVQKELEVEAYRPAVHEALRLLVVTGNALVQITKDGDMRTFRLDSYVVQRHPSGRVDKIVIKEKVHMDTLDPSIRKRMHQDQSTEHLADLYTCVKYNHAKSVYDVFQTVEDVELPETRTTFKPDELPYMALRFTRVTGEDYGRSFVEEHIGDIRSLEGLSQAILEGAAASAKVLFLVSPNGTTKAKTLAESPNGAIVSGADSDVSVLQVGKQADLTVALNTINMIKDRLSKAFMITTDLFRDAERVTAMEIQAIIRQVEKTLGGLFSLLSTEFQLPLIKIILKTLQKQKKIPKLPNEVRPTIVVGVDAIGRAAELEKLDTMLAGMGQMFGPEALGSMINVDEYLRRRATALGVQTDGLVKTAEQRQQEQQQAMMQQAMQQAAMSGGKTGGEEAARAAVQQQMPQQEPRSS
tara:strand:- start:366 stop:2009 length:1644 start_codon:yes stop_codon:yes gene_type:complete